MYCNRRNPDLVYLRAHRRPSTTESFMQKRSCKTSQQVSFRIVVQYSLMFLKSVFSFVCRIWNFFLVLLKKNARKVIAHQTIKYKMIPLSPITRQRLGQVKKKILVLDLDETLIHSRHDGVLNRMTKPNTTPDFVLKVVIDKHPVRFFVHKRPHVDYFLEVVSHWYELVIYTASMEIYGSAVCEKLDKNKGILKRRYYRQHCKVEMGSFTKDLSSVHTDLSSIIIIDNSPGAYKCFPENAIPIKSWFANPFDTALLNLLPMLDSLRFCNDVRSILHRNKVQHMTFQ